MPQLWRTHLTKPLFGRQFTFAVAGVARYIVFVVVSVIALPKLNRVIEFCIC